MQRIALLTLSVTLIGLASLSCQNRPRPDSFAHDAASPTAGRPLDAALDAALDAELDADFDTIIVAQPPASSSNEVGGADRPPEPPPPPQRIGALTYQARIAPEDTGLGTGPMSLRAVVAVSNPTSQPQTLAVAGCTTWLRAYPTPDRTGPPLWEPDGTCTQKGSAITLGPGGSKAFHFRAYDAMLSNALPDGRYYFTALFRRADRVIELPAGSADVRFRVPRLAYHVTMQYETTGHLDLAVSVQNRNDQTTRITYGACALNILAYHGSGRSGPPAANLRGGRSPQRARDRDSATSAQAAMPYSVCLDYGARKDLAPGETFAPKEFRLSVPMDDLFGDDPFPNDRSGSPAAPRRYNLTAVLTHNGRPVQLPAGLDLSPRN